MKQPLVSIIIPVFNRVDLINDTLNSVLNQTYTNWECLMIDDGSSDGTKSILKEYQSKDSRFTFIERPIDITKGANPCRNLGITNSKGDYVQFLDSDDYMDSEKLRLQVNILNQSSNTTVAICDWDRFHSDVSEANFKKLLPYAKNFSSAKLYLNALGKKWIPPLCYLVPRRLIDMAGFWDESIIINQDAEYFVRVLLNCTEVKFVKYARVLYRHHTKGNVSSETAKKVQAKIDTFKLMQDHLKSIYIDEPNLYIEGSKDMYYRRIKRRFPEIIKNNRYFFKSQIKSHGFIAKVKRKLKTLF